MTFFFFLIFHCSDSVFRDLFCNALVVAFNNIRIMMCACSMESKQNVQVEALTL